MSSSCRSILRSCWSKSTRHRSTRQRRRSTAPRKRRAVSNIQRRYAASGTSRGSTDARGSAVKENMGMYEILSHVAMPECSLRMIRMLEQEHVAAHYHEKSAQIYALLGHDVEAGGG